MIRRCFFETSQDKAVESIVFWIEVFLTLGKWCEIRDVGNKKKVQSLLVYTHSKTMTLKPICFIQQNPPEAPKNIFTSKRRVFFLLVRFLTGQRVGQQSQTGRTQTQTSARELRFEWWYLGSITNSCKSTKGQVQSLGCWSYDGQWSY